jgi:hypothetical protein
MRRHGNGASVGRGRTDRDQQLRIMQELADGLAKSIGEIVTPSVHIEAMWLGIRLDLPTGMVEIDTEYPWDPDVPVRESIQGTAEIMLSQAQTELAEATTEPWPFSMAERSDTARGLPVPEVEITGDVVSIRFRSGSDIVELSPVNIEALSV